MLAARNTNKSTDIKFVPFPTDNLTTFKSNFTDYSNTQAVVKLPTKEWGQLKLLITEIQFLNSFWSDIDHPQPHIVYVGAAPGNHINVLIKMFPWAKYHLYDTSTFDPRLEEMTELITSQDFGGVTIYNKFFDLNDIEYWTNVQKQEQNVFMIFDIRNPNYRKELSVEEKDEMIMADLKFQELAIRQIFPAKALIRMKFPTTFVPDPDQSEDKNHFRYLDGIAYRHAYTDKLSQDFSLVITDNISYRLWNLDLMGEAITQHNELIRFSYYLIPYLSKDSQTVDDLKFFDKDLGLIKNFDGNIFYITIDNYLNKFKPFSGTSESPNFEDVISVMKKILTSITKDGNNKLALTLKAKK